MKLETNKYEKLISKNQNINKFTLFLHSNINKLFETKSHYRNWNSFPIELAVS